MRQIGFHNREKEIKEIKNLLDAEPSLITFVYGPINSGKTALINHLIKQLPEDYVVFYINLRTKFLASYDDFIESLFEMELETEETNRKRKETLKELISSVTKVTGIPINREFLDHVFKDKKPKNAFSYIIKLFEAVRDSEKQPVLVLDELQKIGDVKVNGPLIYELFNFFIDLTKELHLAHVFVITSDSLFIERVYSDAMLEGRCRYLLVDDFDCETATTFLEKHGFSDDEKATAWEYCGGKPVCLIEVVNSEKREDKAKEMLMIRISEMKTTLKRVKELGSEIGIEDKSYSVRYAELIDALKHFAEREEIDIEEMDEISTTFLVKKNVLFVDPVRGVIKPQSRLNLHAIRELMN